MKSFADGYRTLGHSHTTNVTTLDGYKFKLSGMLDTNATDATLIELAKNQTPDGGTIKVTAPKSPDVTVAKTPGTATMSPDAIAKSLAAAAGLSVDGVKPNKRSGMPVQHAKHAENGAKDAANGKPATV